MQDFPIWIICLRRRAEREIHPSRLATNPNAKGFYLTLKTDENIIFSRRIFLVVKVSPYSLDLSVSLQCHLETQKLILNRKHSQEEARPVFEASVLMRTQFSCFLSVICTHQFTQSKSDVWHHLKVPCVLKIRGGQNLVTYLSKHSPVPRLYTLYSPIPSFQYCYCARGKSIHPLTGTDASEKLFTVKIQSLITKTRSDAAYVLYVQGTPDRV